MAVLFFSVATIKITATEQNVKLPGITFAIVLELRGELLYKRNYLF